MNTKHQTYLSEVILLEAHKSVPSRAHFLAIAPRSVARYDDSVNIVSIDSIPMREEMNSHVDRQKPKPYHHGDLRNASIYAGLEMLSEGGASALDLRKVARKAGVSHAASYRHFADKQVLVASINEEGFRKGINGLSLFSHLLGIPHFRSPEALVNVGPERADYV